jgi:hypothetical protein
VQSARLTSVIYAVRKNLLKDVSMGIALIGVALKCAVSAATTSSRVGNASSAAITYALIVHKLLRKSLYVQTVIQQCGTTKKRFAV